MRSTDDLIRALPKTDLHMHLEGSIEPEMMLALAVRNGVALPWTSAAALRAAYQFTGLQSFLDLYFEGCRVLVHERDFHDITLAYLRRAREDGVIHAEMFIGPQSFTERGTDIAAVMNGVLAAMEEARRDHGIEFRLLISAHRHRTEAEALTLLDLIVPWTGQVTGIGMGGAEIGHPPSKFVTFFREAKDRGFRTTIHAGEEGPASYVREALDLLNVDRIDHGNACLDDPGLVAELAARKIPLTVCPLSNLRLNVVRSLKQHGLPAMIAAGLHVTINSDDPPYFGGYVTENLIACRDAMGLSEDVIAGLVRNGFAAAFMPPAEAAAALRLVDEIMASHAGLEHP